LQSNSTLSAGRGSLDHVAIPGRDELRDHPGVGEIDLVDGIAGAVADNALWQGELPQIGLQKDKRIIGQGGEQAISRRPGQALSLGPGHRPVCQRVAPAHKRTPIELYSILPVGCQLYLSDPGILDRSEVPNAF
jgi:hypothetical protein